MTKMTKSIGKKVSTKIPATKMTKNNASVKGGMKVKGAC